MIPSTSPWTPARDALIAAIIAANPPLKDEALATILSSATGTDFTKSQVCHRRKSIQLPTIAVSNDRLPLHGIVDFAEAVERRGASLAPDGFTRKTVTITETEIDETSSRRVSTTYAATPSVAQVAPIAQIDYLASPLPVLAPTDGDKQVLIFNDTQFPYEDDNTWRLLLAFARDLNPDLTLAAGDIDDLPTVSRHPRKPKHELPGGLQAEIDYSFARKLELRRALGPVGAPIDGNRYLKGRRKGEVVEIEGNHDMRLETHLLNFAPQMTYLHRCGDADAQPVNSIAHLQRYDEIGWKYIPGYPDAHFQLADDLDVRHGEHARKGSGNSVRQMLDKLPGVSIIQGHTHRQALIGEAVQSLDGTCRTRYGIENGTISRLDGLHYTTYPDWQPGWMVVTLHDDGSWTPELVTVCDGVARFRGRRWATPVSAEAALAA